MRPHTMEPGGNLRIGLGEPGEHGREGVDPRRDQPVVVESEDLATDGPFDQAVVDERRDDEECDGIGVEIVDPG